MPFQNPTFRTQKSQILTHLSQPASEYADLSPKGSIDTEILPLVELANGIDGLVTTSTCAGRVVVWAEAASCSSNPDGSEEGQSRNGLPKKKSGGGRWLLVSHTPLVVPEGEDGVAGVLNLQPVQPPPAPVVEQPQKVWFKFEPPIIHVLTASLEHANLLLGAALAAGFRESGVVSPLGQCPVVAIRTQGLGMNCLVATCDDEGAARPVVSEAYLRMLVSEANERFQGAQIKRDRLSQEIERVFSDYARQTQEWEDKDSRGERKRREGLERRRRIREEREEREAEEDEESYVEAGEDGEFHGFGLLAHQDHNPS